MVGTTRCRRSTLLPLLPSLPLPRTVTISITIVHYHRTAAMQIRSLAEERGVSLVGAATRAGAVSRSARALQYQPEARGVWLVPLLSFWDPRDGGMLYHCGFVVPLFLACAHMHTHSLSLARSLMHPTHCSLYARPERRRVDCAQGELE